MNEITETAPAVEPGVIADQSLFQSWQLYNGCLEETLEQIKSKHCEYNVSFIAFVIVAISTSGAGRVIMRQHDLKWFGAVCFAVAVASVVVFFYLLWHRHKEPELKKYLQLMNDVHRLRWRLYTLGVPAQADGGINNLGNLEWLEQYRPAQFLKTVNEQVARLFATQVGSSTSQELQTGKLKDDIDEQVRQFRELQLALGPFGLSSEAAAEIIKGQG